ncbi:MAG: CoA pyrophosphatase [Desulfobacterota bacterium]|nr:CoA pyrophosphatase [Thermodesulfobacteriota bacterium]MDW8001785.1 CoA pyrophosphatase [Deltaproteobacteria bacterium]
MNPITRKEIERKISLYEPKKIKDDRAKRAAVLVPIYAGTEPLSIILTKRTTEVRIHKGEVSFPGGVCEKTDGNTLDAALRESFEEIGLKRQDLEVLGRLDDLYTISGYLVSPYVAWINSPYNFRLSRREVAFLIFLPLDIILSPDFKNEDSLIYSGETIFGATLRILKNLSSVIISD